MSSGANADVCVYAKYDKPLFLQALISASRAVCQAIICPLDGATRLPLASPGSDGFPDRGAMKLWRRAHRPALRADVEKCVFMTIVGV